MLSGLNTLEAFGALDRRDTPWAPPEAGDWGRRHISPLTPDPGSTCGSLRCEGKPANESQERTLVRSINGSKFCRLRCGSAREFAPGR
jgi:hypothetical protein